MRLRDIKIGWPRWLTPSGNAKGGGHRTATGRRASVSVRYERRKTQCQSDRMRSLNRGQREEARQTKVKAHREGKAAKLTPGVRTISRPFLGICHGVS